MTRLDFYGVLFVHFPAVMPWDQARRELERLIRESGGDVITHTTIHTALFWREWKLNEILRRNSPALYRLRVIEAKNERAKRRAEFLKKQDDWSF